MRSRSRSRERRRRSPQRDRGRREGAERRSRSPERDRGRREGAERRSPRPRPGPSPQAAGAAVQAHRSAVAPATSAKPPATPSDGGSRAQQPAREGAERISEETRARKQEPPARLPRRDFQPLVPLGGLETAEQLLFGASPTLPLRCPNFANFPKLWKGQVLSHPRLCATARALPRRDATQCAGLCFGPPNADEEPVRTASARGYRGLPRALVLGPFGARRGEARVRGGWTARFLVPRAHQRSPPAVLYKSC